MSLPSVRLLSAGLTIGLLLRPVSAPAQPQSSAESPRERARALATQGYEALQAKDYRAAEDLFRRADALVHAPTIVVDHARALVGLGRLVEAHEKYELVLREGIPGDAPWSWRRAQQEAERELEAIQPRLAWLTVVVRGPVKPLVYLDGRQVPIAALGVRRATDPGARSLRVSGAGYLPYQATLQLKEGETRAVQIELKRDASGELPLEEEKARGPVVVSTAPATPASSVAAYVALGLGGAGVLAGTISGMRALEVRSALKSECGGRVCVPSTEQELADKQSRIDKYRLLGTISGVSFAIGAAALATSGVLFVLRPRETSRPDPSATLLLPYVGAREAGVVGQF
ncbi:MAG TPA: hypothetical protein VFQ61_08445 [Polyangiaceae bacterium]|nr:hypothetical protein [Polyangiaceae bacterium]